VGLACIIPAKHFKSLKQYYTIIASLIVVVCFTVLAWSTVISGQYISYADYNEAYQIDSELPVCSNMHLQTDHLANEGISGLGMILHTIGRDFKMYSSGYIGTFGWMDTHLPAWFFYIAYGIIFIIAVSENNKGHRITWKNKIIFFSCFSISVVLIVLSQYLLWECVGNDFVSVIQGRYLIPVAPLLFMLFSAPFKISNWITVLIVVSFSLFSILFSVFRIYDRYFSYAFKKPATIFCDMDRKRWGPYFKTSSVNIYLAGAELQSDESSISGKHSCKLSNDHPYGSGLLYYGGEKGDSIITEVWLYGQDGDIVMSGFNGTDSMFHASSKVVETNDQGWKKIRCDYTLRYDMNGYPLSIFLQNTGRDPVYFDDMTITILQSHE